jgi:hypothetical protein
VPRNAAQSILHPVGAKRKSRPDDVALKVGNATKGSLDFELTQSSFARDSAYQALAEKTHAEIFKTEKDHVKRQINYSNYSLHPSNLITNKPMNKDRVLGKYVNEKIMDYKTPYVKDLRCSI